MRNRLSKKGFSFLWKSKTWLYWICFLNVCYTLQYFKVRHEFLWLRYDKQVALLYKKLVSLCIEVWKPLCWEVKSLPLRGTAIRDDTLLKMILLSCPWIDTSLWLPNTEIKSKAFPNKHRSDIKYYTGFVCLNYFVGPSLLLTVLVHLK